MEDVHTDETREARRLLAIAFDSMPGDPATVGDGLLRAVRRRNARRRRTRALVSAGGAVAAAATAAAVLLSVTVAGAPAALAAVTGALSRTAEQSFRMNLVITQVPGQAGLPLYITGELDLKRNLGEETMSNGWRALIVAGEAYTELPPAQARDYGMGRKLWTETPLWATEPPFNVPYRSAGAQLAWDFNSGRPFNPQGLLALLESGANVIDEGSASGPGWTGTRYRFTVSHPQDTGGIVESITCTVDVDSHGRIRSLAQTTAFSDAIVRLDFTFSDFGLRFSVSPPPASQVSVNAGLGVQF